MTMGVGTVSETITVSSTDIPIALASASGSGCMCVVIRTFFLFASSFSSFAAFGCDEVGREAETPVTRTSAARFRRSAEGGTVRLTALSPEGTKGP